MSTICPMGPVCVGFTPGMSPEVGQYDLFATLKVELDYNNLIRNISPMQWNLKVQPISNYFFEMALQVYIKI